MNSTSILVGKLSENLEQYPNHNNMNYELLDTHSRSKGRHNGKLNKNTYTDETK